MEIIVNIPGLSELAASISTLAWAMSGQATTTGTAASPPASAPGPNLTLVPPQPVAVPVTGPVPAAEPAPASAGVPITAQSYTLEQLAVAATQLMDAGKRTDLVSLLAKFGVQALTLLPKEQYGTFATELRALGARI
jgi:hypothetical protein